MIINHTIHDFQLLWLRGLTVKRGQGNCCEFLLRYVALGLSGDTELMSENQVSGDEVSSGGVEANIIIGG
jgi:hypothetical protein